MKEMRDWDYFEEKSKKYIANKRKENKLIKNLDKKYYLLAFIGDIHLGGFGVNYEKAREDATLIGKTENAYAILGGDLIDNFIKANILSGLINQASNIETQMDLLKTYLDFFKDNILCVISGNHELRTLEVSGLDFFKLLYNRRKLLFSNNDFFIELRFKKDVRYKIYIRHKYRYNSSFNLTHTVKQMLRLGDYVFDIGVVGHNHQYCIEDFVWKKEKKLAIRVGSYKEQDSFSQKVGFNSSDSIMPSVIVSPFKKQMYSFSCLKTAIDFLKFKNKGIEK